jgi:hypothetical protein
LTESTNQQANHLWAARSTAPGPPSLGLRAFLEGKLSPWFEDRKREIASRPLRPAISFDRLRALALFEPPRLLRH